MKRFIHSLFFTFLLLSIPSVAQPLLITPDEPEPATPEPVPPVPSAPRIDLSEEIMDKVDPTVVSIQHEHAGGTGFIISEDGYILTNGHVVIGSDPEEPTRPAQRVTVVLNDDRTFRAEVRGFSMDPDVALLKIEAGEPLVPVEFADSHAAQVGQRSFAVGTPVGLRRTYTSGILSNVRRTDLGTETVVFQTDAAINRGNSGGPLFDSEGRVLGINTYASRGQNNIGFTIPIHVALDMVEDFKNHGRFVRSWVPLFFTGELYDELRRALDIDQGILITFVMPGSVADELGLQRGDILRKVDGEEVGARNFADLLDFEWSQTIRPPGEEITLTVLRGEPGEREEFSFTATLEEVPRFPAFNRHLGELPEHRYASLGLGVEALTPIHKIIHQIPGEPSGVFVKHVADGSAAARADLRQGDVIRTVGKTSVTNISEFRDALDGELRAADAAITLRITRNHLDLVTALAPDYLMRNRRVLLLAPNEGDSDLDLIHRELLARGAQIRIITPDAATLALNPEDRAVNSDGTFADAASIEADVLLLLGGSGGAPFTDHPEVLQRIQEALEDSGQVVAAVGGAALALVSASEEPLEAKITLPREFSGEAIRGGATYTGQDVESDKQVVTTTGSNRQIIREFLNTLANLR